MHRAVTSSTRASSRDGTAAAAVASSVRILIAEDHEMIRRALRQLIERRVGWEICGEAAAGTEAVGQAKRLQPDIAIIDVGISAGAGIDFTRELHSVAPNTEMLIFTVHDSEEMVRALIDTGVRGYVLKSDPMTEIVSAIETLAIHKAYVTGTISEPERCAFLEAMAVYSGTRSPSGREAW
jgi:DNA-binding NarL/FixJ family response regulator